MTNPLQAALVALEKIPEPSFGAVLTELSGKVELYPAEYKRQLLAWWKQGALAALSQVASEPVEPSELYFAVLVLIQTLDNYPDQLVPINRDSAMIRELRKLLDASAQPAVQQDS